MMNTRKGVTDKVEAEVSGSEGDALFFTLC